MSDTFQFKQFSVRQDRCAMKVGTDGILLGAWCRQGHAENGSCRILDIGTGTGIVALMLAQRYPDAILDAIEIDSAAHEQAADNFHASVWRERLFAIRGCVRDYVPECRYSLIASNPPWFNKSLKSKTLSRNLARHDDGLSQAELLEAVNRMLVTGGRFCTILPIAAGYELMRYARDSEMYCHRCCEVRPTPGKPPKRLLLEFAGTEPASTCEPESLIVETTTRHEYTSEFRELTREFYLRF